jgi:hypothetical protein
VGRAFAIGSARGRTGAQLALDGRALALLGSAGRGFVIGAAGACGPV